MTDQLLTLLKDLTPEQAVEKRDQWGIPQLAVYCAGTAEPTEQKVLACQWGEGYNSMQDGRALFWWDHGTWKTQPYPVEGVLGVGSFHSIRREGTLLQVVMNVAKGQTRMVEHVGLLQFDGGIWRVVWGPQTSSPYPAGSVLFQPPHGIDRYTLFRVEGDVFVREDWGRDEASYLQIRRVELSQEEYAVVRFVLALLRHNDHELRYWATSQALAAAQNLASSDSLRAGFTTRQGTDGMVLLETDDRVHTWQLSMTRDEGFWKVTSIHRTAP